MRKSCVWRAKYGKWPPGDRHWAKETRKAGEPLCRVGSCPAMHRPPEGRWERTPEGWAGTPGLSGPQCPGLGGGELQDSPGAKRPGTVSAPPWGEGQVLRVAPDREPNPRELVSPCPVTRRGAEH